MTETVLMVVLIAWALSLVGIWGRAYSQGHDEGKLEAEREAERLAKLTSAGLRRAH